MAIDLTGATYVQDFDSLANTGATSDILPLGWLFFETGSNADTTYGINNGSSNAGNTYSYGDTNSSERAFGTLASGSLVSTIGARFVNQTGSTITGLTINYTGEQWRSSTTTQNVLTFSYQIGATGLNTGTWTTFSGLDYVGALPVATNGSLDGNANTTGISGELTGLNVAPGQEIWIRWVDVNDAGSDAGLAIDNFSVTPVTGEPPDVPTVTIAATDANAAEASTTVEPGSFTITRSGDTAAALTVNYTVGGTATNGEDYNPLSGSVTIPVGQSSVTFTITPVNDADATEGDETVNLTLVDAAAYDLGTANTATVTIADNTTGVLQKIGGITGSGAEIPAFDPASDRLFVVAGSTVEIYSIGATGALTALGNLVPGFTPTAGINVLPNSVAVKNGIVAVAYALVDDVTDAQQPGQVSFYNAADGSFLNSVEVGFLPDMVTFTPDGTKVLTANEGEPNSYGQADSFDPEGSVSIIDLAGGVASATVQTADFTAFNAQIDTLRDAGVRIFGPGATVAQDLEPEYIAFSGDGTKAYVTLQENNALAIVDIATATVTEIKPLGLKDHSLPGQGLDASDRDGGINIQNWPVFGMYQPDAIASYTVGGQTYYITANEGDARDYDGFAEEVRVGSSDYILDPTVFPNAVSLKEQANLGRLTVTNATGDTDGDGDFDRIDVFGGRSFSIWDSNGNLVFDSGDQFERITAEQVPAFYNSNGNFANLTEFDTRSDNKGPEPEGVVVGVVNGRTYAFIGLERVGDVIVYDVTNPTAPEFIEYINTPEDIGVEGLTFIPAGDSPTGKALLVTANEVSNTVAVFEFIPPQGPTAIYDIQGESHTSPLLGQTVTTTGIVTAVSNSGFYLQDPTGDGNIATSDAIFVFTSSRPSVAVGDGLEVTGTVSEFTPGGASTRNLSTTQLSGNPAITVLSSGNPLPAATIIGAGGRVPPTEAIDPDAFTIFNPNTDGIDFFESLEGMRVTANDFRATTGTNRFGEIFGVVDNGVGATGLSDRGTLNIGPFDFNGTEKFDFNPETVQAQFDRNIFDFTFPQVNTGAFLGDVTGVLGYSFGNFEILVTEDFTANVEPSTLQPEFSTLVGGNGELLVASYNVLNLNPAVAPVRFNALASQIINNLNTPDIIALQEIQDNSGPVNDGVTAADETLQTLVNAITDAGGPTYAFIDNPFVTNNAGGGAPGSNIRNAYLYNPNRVALVPDSVSVIGSQETGEAFFATRQPLIAKFVFNDETVTLVNNHFSSKNGSAPIMGAAQPSDERQEDPTVNASVDRRRAQSEVVQEFVNDLLGTDPNANVVVLGDFNEFEFLSPVRDLAANTGLVNLTETLPENERYTFNFQGNSQAIDHILASGSLATDADFDIVHVNTEFFEASPLVASDHEPILARFNIQATNVINGTPRRDVLVGTDGNDIILGSQGSDRITTGGGRDRVVYTSLTQAGDTITDFAIGFDKLVFTDLLDSLNYSGSNPITDGILRFVSQGNSSRTVLQIDPDGFGGSARARNFAILQGVDAVALNNVDNFVF
jgi:hypothetical protein